MVFAGIATVRATSCAGTIRHCGRYCQSNRTHFLSFPIGRNSFVAASGIVSRSMSRLLKLLEAMNRTAIEPCEKSRVQGLSPIDSPWFGPLGV